MCQLRQPEVEHLDLPALRHEDVRRLDVAVNQPEGVRRVERIGDLHAEVEHRLHRQRSVREPPAQGGPVEQLHDEKRQIAMAPDVIERADVRMAERRCRTRFTLKALERKRILRQLRREKFDGNLAAETRVLRAIDDTHAAFANLVEDPVMGNGLANHLRANLSS